MILLIDNYDSFVHNLGRHFGMLGYKREVVRNDQITLDAIAALRPEAIVLSPGPRAPKDSGICIDVIRAFGPTTPILGVCLGHQCIGEAYGGRTVRAERPMQGKTSQLDHPGTGLFLGLPNPLKVARYHSLVTELPANHDLRVTSRTKTGEIMAMQHLRHPVYGMQFHPESILTEHGLDLLRNFMTLAMQWNTGGAVRQAA